MVQVLTFRRKPSSASLRCHGIQLPVVRDEALVKLFPLCATGTPRGSISDAPGSFSVELRFRLLPEHCRLGESHDLAEALSPRVAQSYHAHLPKLEFAIL